MVFGSPFLGVLYLIFLIPLILCVLEENYVIEMRLLKEALCIGKYFIGCGRGKTRSSSYKIWHFQLISEKNAYYYALFVAKMYYTKTL